MTYGIIAIIIGVIMGGAAFFMGEAYSKKRFGADDEVEAFATERFLIGVILSGIVSFVCYACGKGVGAYDFSFSNFGSMTGLRYIVLASTLPFISWIDIKKRIIPNAWIVGLLAVRFVILVLDILVMPEQAVFVIISAITGLLMGGLIFLPVRLIRKDSIGMGDIKLYAVIGLYMGGRNVLSVEIMSLVVAVIYGFVMMALKKNEEKGKISLGPCIAIGTLLIMMMGV